MTEFETIYNRFSQKITDYKLMQLDDDSLSELLLGWLHSSIAKFRICKSDLSDRAKSNPEPPALLPAIGVPALPAVPHPYFSPPLLC